MRTLVLNDIHHGITRESTSHPGVIRQANSNSLFKLEQLLEKLSAENFDSAMQLGDLIREVGSKDTDEKLLREVLKSLKKFPIDFLHLAGNHDLDSFSQAELQEIFVSEGHNPELCGVEQFPEVQIVRLDIKKNGNNGALLTDERLEQLSSLMEPDKNTLVFSHYPVSPFSGKGTFYFDLPGSEEWMAYHNRKQIMDFFSNFPVKAYISAHIHFAGYKQSEGQNFISLPAFAENIAAEEYQENNPAIYSLVEFDKGSLTVKSYSGEFSFFSIEV